MKNIKERAEETKKYFEEKKQKEFEDYKNGDEKYKQNYWNNYVYTIWWYNERGTQLPIDIKNLRKIYKGMEDNIEKFILGTIDSLKEEGFFGKIEDIFTFDEKAKNIIKIQSSLASNFKNIDNILES